MEELDPAGGERRKGGKEGEKDGGRVQRREGEGKSTPIPRLYPFSHFLFSCLSPLLDCFGVTMSQKHI